MIKITRYAIWMFMLGRFSTAINRITRATLTDPLRRFQLSLLTLVLLTLFGTFGYMRIEDWSFGEGLYMTIITIATVGFGEIKPLSETGRSFTILLILLGVGAATTAISNAVSIVLGPLLWTSMQRRRLEQQLMNLENHYIVCGYGRMGRQIVRDLQARDESFVVVDASPETEERFLEEKFLHVIGDATEDDVLIEAGVQRAKGLVASLSSDAGNVMTVLTAREMNPDLYIVARVVRPESESKLLRAGANDVINPYQIGGHRIALSLLRPVVHDFLRQIFHFGEGQDIDIGQITIDEGSRLSGQTIAKCDLRSIYNVNVLGIMKPDRQLVITPNPSTQLETGMTLIVIGPPEAIYNLEKRED